MGKGNSATHDEGAVSVLGEDNPGVRRVGSDRMAAMEALASMRRDQVSDESGVKIDAPKSDDPDNPDDDDKVVDPDETDAQRQAREAAAAEAARRKEAEDQLRRQAGDDDRVVLSGDLSRYHVKTKVDGVEQEVPLSKAITEIQKGLAADRRLEEAGRIKKAAVEEAERIKQEAAAELAAAKETGSKAAIERAKERDDAAKADLEEKRKKLKAAGDALFAGDTEAFTETVLELVEGTRETATPAINVDQITAAVTAKVEQQAALKKFATTYPEIMGSDYLAAMADDKVKQLVKDGKSFDDALTGAGEYVRGELKALAKGLGMTDAGGSTGTRVDRHSRKSEIEESIETRSAQASNTSEQKPASASDVIQQMREARMPKPRAQAGP